MGHELRKADFQGKVVLDVGCGTGILSLFAAQVRCSLFLVSGFWHSDSSLPSLLFVYQAGALRVYAVEASETAELAK
jgi:methylase of polypeptide subunit release factors